MRKKTKTRARRAVGLSLLLVGAPLLAMAQSSSATLSGKCRDASGGVLGGVMISVRNTGTAEVRTAQAAADGWYRVVGLPPGSYDVTASLQGLKTVTQSGAVLTVGETHRLDFTLEVGAVTEAVEVSAPAPVVNAEEGRLSYFVSERQIADLPLNGRNALQLVELQPGTTTNTLFAGPFSGTQANGNTAAINGQRNRSNNFILDGIDNNDQFTGGRVALVPSVDMIQEFRMSTNSFSAEFGRNSSAAVTVVTKSGTNSLHGTAYEFWRDEILPSGRGVFDSPNAPKSPFSYHQYGGTIGGPVKRNRFFFFASYEGVHSKSQFNRFETVETPEFRRLVAERFPNSVANYLFQRYPSPNPTQDFRDTGRPVTGLATNHVDNTPSIATNPNFTATGGGFYTNSAQSVRDGIPDLGTAIVPVNSRTEADQFSLRLDAELSATRRLFARYIYDRRLTDNLQGPLRSVAFTRPGRPRAHNLALGHTWILSKHAVMETKLGVNRLDINSEERDPGVPIITLNDGMQSFGGAIILRTLDHTFHLTNTVSTNLGRHGLKFGAEVRHVDDDVGAPFNRPSLSFQNMHDFAQDEVFSINTIGIDPRSRLAVQNSRVFRYNEIGVFVQDDWKLRSNLTLNAGLRYEWFGRPTEKDGRMGTLVLGPGSDFFERVRTGTAGQVDQLRPNDLNNFGPRLGLSWDPSGRGRFVVRTGYGLMYDRLFGNSYANVQLNPPFYSQTGASPVFTAAHRGIPIPYGPTNPDGSRNVGEPVRADGPNQNLGVGSDSGLFGNIIGWNPRFGTSTQGLRVPDLFRGDSYYHNWFLGVQVGLWRGIALEANYVGNVGRDLGRLIDYNAVPGDLFDGRLDRLNPNFGAITYRSMDAKSQYNALQLNLRRQSQGFSAQLSYTLGKAMDDDSDVQTGRGTTDTRNLGADWAVADFDVRHRFVANWTWELPFFKSGTGMKRALLGGWQLNGIYQYQTSYPFNVFTSASYPNGDFNGDGRLNDRPDLPSYGLNPPQGMNNDAYIAGFLQASDFPRPQGRSGNLPRNAYRGPRFTTANASVFKNFSVGSRGTKIQLRAEVFNVFNSVNLLLQGFFGDLTSGLFARSTSSYGARQMQLAVKVIY